MDTAEAVKQMQECANVGAPMPQYRCHKKVWALKIAEIHQIPDGYDMAGDFIIVPEERGYAAFAVSREYVNKHEPQIGGYYVVYADGYKSWSPAQAFEEGYARI